jgi:hypothetical protein
LAHDCRQLARSPLRFFVQASGAACRSATAASSASGSDRRADPAPVLDIKKSRQVTRRPRRKPVQREIATEFLPVAVDDGWTPLDGGRLVRVKLPRRRSVLSDCRSMNCLAPERVQADVMLSNDGILRAIRFVR